MEKPFSTPAGPKVETILIFAVLTFLVAAIRKMKSRKNDGIPIFSVVKKKSALVIL